MRISTRVKAVLIISLSTVAIFATLFNTSKRESEFGLFGEGNNPPPCWWKVCAGQIYDREYLLNLLKVDKRISSIDEDKHLVSVSFTMYDLDKERAIKATFPLYGKLKISLDPYYTIRLGELIKKYGYPQFVGVVKYPSSSGCSVDFYYPALGMLINSYTCAVVDGAIIISKDTLVDRILLTDSNDIQRFLELYPYEKWHGYGTYAKE
ncbi:MAG: hypothetical protein LLG44_11630 [Chloroflexi bacterium]|nr:hypothetical protein [Chloroflexota bacterium]